ncbi:MAG: glycosyltransferase, partial [Microbacteriaceae bacterium]
RFFYLLHCYRFAYWSKPVPRWVRKQLKGASWDIVIAHDIETMLLANTLNSRVIADLHEYAPRQYEHSKQWVRTIAPYYRWICKHEVVKAAGVVTVSEGIAREYSRNFDVEVEVITNATSYIDLFPGEVSFPIKLVHSGLAASHRKLEVMIDAVQDTTTAVELHFYLVADAQNEYFQFLKNRASANSNIFFHEEVPYSTLIETLNSFDVGVYIMAPTSFNHEKALPNKFFDFIQARLGLIIGPSEEMVALLQEFGFGAVSNDFSAESFTKVLDSLNLEQIAQWKQNSHQSARELSGEKQMEKLEQIILRILLDTEELS